MMRKHYTRFALHLDKACAVPRVHHRKPSLEKTCSLSPHLAFSTDMVMPSPLGAVHGMPPWSPGRCLATKKAWVG